MLVTIAVVMAFPRLVGSNDDPSYALAVVFLSLAVVFGIRDFTGPKQGQIRQMTPDEMEKYLDGLSPKKRERMAAQLLAHANQDEEYLSNLSSDQRTRFDALLQKLKAECEARSN